MDSKQLFEAALSINDPWFIDIIEFSAESKKLDIFIDFKKGSTFSSKDPAMTGKFKVYDTEVKTWRHLNFFEHECFLHCRTPRIRTDDTHIELVSPPWSGLNSGFTLLFEALLIQLCSSMPISAVSRLINETSNKIWRLLDKYIAATRQLDDFSDVTTVGIDETAKAKGHDYISLFVDLEKKRTIFVAEGKDHQTIKEFSQDLKDHQGHPDNITDVSCDMSPAYIKGVTETFKDARITFDRFHVMKLINDAVDQVRKAEVSSQPILKKSKYVFLKNQQNLTKQQQEKLQEIKLSKLNLKTLRALNIRETFQNIYTAQTENEFVLLLKKWYFWATHSRIEPIKKVAKTIKNHWDGIVQWKRSLINNGVLEGLNSVIQAAKAKARGYRTFRNYKIMVYLITGKLNFGVVNPCIRH